MKRVYWGTVLITYIGRCARITDGKPGRLNIACNEYFCNEVLTHMPENHGVPEKTHDIFQIKKLNMRSVNPYNQNKAPFVIDKCKNVQRIS